MRTEGLQAGRCLRSSRLQDHLLPELRQEAKSLCIYVCHPDGDFIASTAGSFVVGVKTRLLHWCGRAFKKAYQTTPWQHKSNFHSQVTYNRINI